MRQYLYFIVRRMSIEIIISALPQALSPTVSPSLLAQLSLESILSHPQTTDWSCVERLSQLKMPQVLLRVNLKALNQSYLSSVIKEAKALNERAKFQISWTTPSDLRREMKPLIVGSGQGAMISLDPAKFWKEIMTGKLQLLQSAIFFTWTNIQISENCTSNHLLSSQHSHVNKIELELTIWNINLFSDAE